MLSAQIANMICVYKDPLEHFGVTGCEVWFGD